MYKNPSCTVDIIVKKGDAILLIKRRNAPYKNKYALPGGFINYGKETLEQAATRELKEETGLIAFNLFLLNNYSSPKRDSRGHVISHVYYTTDTQGVLKAGDDAKEAKWFDINNLPKLAFDHNKIINDYKERVNEHNI